MWAPAGDDEGRWPPTRKLRLGSCMTGQRVEASSICNQSLERCSPARMAVYRLLTIVRKCRGAKRVGVVEEREGKQSGEKRREKEKLFIAANKARRDLPKPISENRSRDDASGSQTQQEMTFNLAAGVGFLSLIAASKTELDKTMELRREMEVYLTSFKEEHQSNNGRNQKPFDSQLAYAVGTTFDNHTHSLSQHEIGNSLVYDIDKHYQLHEADERKVPQKVLNNLEDEMAAELERLDVDEETGGSSEDQEDSQKPSTETATRSMTLSSGEVIDPQDEGTPESYGVPPLELERRLHELLEARQEERIRELEDHLECMKKKLQEKEVEVSWWKETAKLISKQVPESSR